MLDFDRPIHFLVNGKKIHVAKETKPDLGILLEDVRTRGDRQNPFWQKFETETGRVK